MNTTRQTELMCLAAVMRYNLMRSSAEADTLLVPDHFASEDIRAMVEAYRALDAPDKHRILMVEGKRYIGLEAECSRMEVSYTDAAYYAGQVKDLHVLRLINGIVQMSKEKNTGYDTLFFLIEKLNAIESDARECIDDNSHEQFVRQFSKGNLLRFGFDPLDAIIGGFDANAKIVIGARPSRGKTSLACQLALSLAKRGISSAYFSKESQPWQVRRRMVANLTRTGLSEIAKEAERVSRTGEHNELSRSLLQASESLSSKYGMLFVESSQSNAETVARRMIEVPHSVCIVDYIQKFRGKDLRQAVGDASGMFASLADRYSKTIIMLSQINRTVGEERRPTMSDLKESGDIEQDGDIIILIHPKDPEHFHADGYGNPATVVDVELIVAKNRDGATGITECQWNKSMSWFFLTDNHHEPQTNF